MVSVAGHFDQVLQDGLHEGAAALVEVSGSERKPVGSSVASHENYVPDAVPQSQATVFKFGQGTVIGLRSKAFGGVGEHGFCAQHLQHLIGIGLPVGGTVQIAAGLEALG